jgi:prolyl 4-hydroxylase
VSMLRMVATATFCLVTVIVKYFGAEAGASFLESSQSKLSLIKSAIVSRNRLSLARPSKTSGDGRGFGSPVSSSSKAKARKTNKGKNEKENLDVQTIYSDPSIDRNTATSIVLDRWGLPPPKVEDIFPLLPKETELIPISRERSLTIDDIQTFIQDVFPNNLNWRYISIQVSISRSNDLHVSKNSPSMNLQLAHVSPPILVIDNFLTEQECLDVLRVVLTEKGEEIRNNRNVVRVQSKTISQYALSTRTSTSWFCSYKCVPTVLAKFQHVLGISDLSQCEEPQIVQYQSGQEFSWHYDEIPTSQLSNGGQRLATILIYLNTVPLENGGSTTFRDLTNGKTDSVSPLFVQPKMGTAVIFYPSNIHGRPDDRTLHRSVPIVGDGITKWILQIWVHERSYVAAVPGNNRVEDAFKDIDIASRQLGYIKE